MRRHRVSAYAETLCRRCEIVCICVKTFCTPSCQHLNIFVCNWLTHIPVFHTSAYNPCVLHHTIQCIQSTSVQSIQLSTVWQCVTWEIAINVFIYLLLFYLLAVWFSFIYIYHWSDFLSCKVLFNLFVFIGCKIYFIYSLLVLLLLLAGWWIFCVFIFYNVFVFFIGCMIFSHLLYYYHLSGRKEVQKKRKREAGMEERMEVWEEGSPEGRKGIR